MLRMFIEFRERETSDLKKKRKKKKSVLIIKKGSRGRVNSFISLLASINIYLVAS
jgi:hypothetical protein